MKVNLGKYDAIRMIAQNLIAFGTFLMVGFGIDFKTITGWLFWYLYIPLVSLIFLWIYVNYIYPASLKWTQDQNVDWRDLLRDVKEIKQTLGR